MIQLWEVLRTFTWSVAYGQSWVTAPLPPQGGNPKPSLHSRLCKY
jgi:hypothetical protein